jgi:hypothetical protein
MLFGGRDGSTPYDNTWIYDLSENKWEERTFTTKPSKMFAPGLANVFGTTTVVLFGGFNAIPLGETWYFNYNPYNNGTFLSSTYDTGANSTFNSITWNATTPANTIIQFQLRSSLDETDLLVHPFIGPDGLQTTYYDSSPSSIWQGHYGDKWIQIKALLSTTDLAETPVLKDVSINYNSIPDLILLSPGNNSIFSSSTPKFMWNFYDFDSAQQSSFQLIIDNETDFVDIDFDSGEIASSDEFWQFPAGTSYTEIPNGLWYWKARVKDEDGTWSSFTSHFNFTIDIHPPTSSSINPVNNKYYSLLNRIEGVSSDDSKGIGVKQVEIMIQQQSNNYYWSGTEWSPLQTWLMTTGTTEWNYDSSDVKWSSGIQYIIQTRATDNINNIEIPSGGIIFSIDLVGPTSTITTPENNTFIKEISHIKGNAQDVHGSGIENIELNIQRESDNFYWNGNDWTFSESWFETVGFDIWSYDMQDVKLHTDTIYYVKSRGIDKLNNFENPSTGISFMYDISPPINQVVTINDDNEFTTTRVADLKIEGEDTGSGINQMCFSQDDIAWTEWIDFNAEYNLDLESGDGIKTIYFKTKDRAGNIAEPVTDTIILDTVAPKATIRINEGASVTNTTSVILNLEAEDDTSGISMMSFSSDGDNWNDWETFSENKSYELQPGDGNKLVYFRVKDNAELISIPVVTTIELKIIQNITPPDDDNQTKPDDDNQTMPDDDNQTMPDDDKKDSDSKSGTSIQDYSLYVIIIVIIIIVLVLLVIVNRRKKESVSQIESEGVEKITASTVVAKPGSITAPTITMDTMPEPVPVEQLPEGTSKDIDLEPLGTADSSHSGDVSDQSENPPTPVNESSLGPSVETEQMPRLPPSENNITPQEAEKELDLDTPPAESSKTPESSEDISEPDVIDESTESKKNQMKLQRLGELRSKGLISEEDFEKRKQELLK